jgi:hypothetical protein
MSGWGGVSELDDLKTAIMKKIEIKNNFEK